MAGAQTVFSVLFEIQAKLNGNFNNSFANAQNAARKLQTELAGINAVQNKIGGYQKQAEALEKNRGRLAALTEEQARLRQEMSQSEQPSAALRRAYDRNANQIAQTTARIREQEQSLNALGDELREAGVDTDHLSEENDRLAQSYERVQQNQAQLSHIADAQQKNAAAISATKAQLVGTVGAISAVGAAIYAGPVQNAIAFESQMANVSTLLDGDTEKIRARVQELSKDVINISNATGLATDNLNDGLYQVISALGDSGDSARILEIASKSAKAGGATTTDAINLLSAVTKGYGDTTARAQQQAADLAFQTVKLGQTSFPELASSMGAVIPLASTLSVKQQDLFGAMATLTGVTGGTAEVATQLKATMQGFLSPSKSMAESLEKMGFASGKAMLESEGLQGSLELLKKSVGGDELAFAGLFSSVEAQNAVLALAGAQADNFTSKTQQMYEAGGAADAAFSKIADTTETRIAKAKIALQNLQKVFGDVFLPCVTTTAERVTGLVQTFSAWAQENPELLKTLVKVGAGVAALAVGGKAAKLGFLEVKGGVLAVQGAFASLKAMGGIKGVIGNMGGIKGIFGGIGGKLLPVIGIITAIGVAIKLVSGNIEEVRGFIQKTFGDSGLAVFDKLWSTITAIGNAMKGVFSGGDMSGVRDFFQNTFGSAGVAAFDAMIGVVEQLKAVLPGLLDQLGQMAAQVFPALMGIASALVPVIAQVASAILPVIVSLIGQLLPVIIQIASAVLPVLIQTIQTIVPVLAEIVNAILPVLIQLFNTFMPIISQLVTAILPVLQQILSALQPVIQVLAELFGSSLALAIGSAQTVINGFLAVLQGIITFITGVFSGNWKQAWEGVKQIFSGVMESLKGIVKAPINFIINALNTLIGGLNNIKIPDWVPGVGGKAINIPKIPMLAKGSRNAPDTFIAGERGPELITNGKGRTVFTARQTERILSNAGNTAPGADAVQQVVVTIAPALLAALSRAAGKEQDSRRAEPQQAAAAQQVIVNLAPAFTAALTAPQAPDGGAQPPQTSTAVQPMGIIAPAMAAALTAQKTPDNGAEPPQAAAVRAMGNLAQTLAVTLAAPAIRNIASSGAAQAQNAAAQQVIVNLAPAMAATLAAAPAMNTVQNSVNLPEVQAAELQPAPPRQSVFNFNSNPVFNINGGDADEVRRICKEWHDQTLQDAADMMQQAEDDERRGRYE